MFSLKLSAKPFFSVLALSGCLIAGMQTITWAQNSNPGLVIFGGVDREKILDYHLDFGGRADGWDRYRLKIPAKKMTQGAAKFFISYLDKPLYEGKFDTEKVEVRIKGGKESVPLRSVNWDKESRIIEIDLAQPITESQKVEIVFSNVKNPDNGGTFYFNCEVLGAGNIPIRQYLGTWIVSIGN